MGLVKEPIGVTNAAALGSDVDCIAVSVGESWTDVFGVGAVAISDDCRLDMGVKWGE